MDVVRTEDEDEQKRRRYCCEFPRCRKAFAVIGRHRLRLPLAFQRSVEGSSQDGRHLGTAAARGDALRRGNLIVARGSSTDHHAGREAYHVAVVILKFVHVVASKRRVCRRHRGAVRSAVVRQIRGAAEHCRRRMALDPAAPRGNRSSDRLRRWRHAMHARRASRRRRSWRQAVRSAAPDGSGSPKSST